MRLTLYVDDLTVSVRGAAQFVKTRLAEAVDQVVHTFQCKLALQVSIAKFTVVASKVKLASAIEKKSKAKELKPGPLPNSWALDVLEVL